MDKVLQWTLQLGQNVTVDVVNLDVMSRQQFFLEIKLDDFTSGFWVSYADMAGGWEEVAAAGGWTGSEPEPV